MFANGTTGSYTPYRGSFINDLILAVRSLDRAFQITCRTIMNCICSESAHRDTLTARVMACRCEEERRVCRAHRASFPLSSELTAIVIEYARNAAAEYTISQMIRENSGWPVRLYAERESSFSPFSLRSTIEANGQRIIVERTRGWIGAGVIRAGNVVPSILKRSRMTVTFEIGARCYYPELWKIGDLDITRKFIMNASRIFMDDIMHRDIYVYFCACVKLFMFLLICQSRFYERQ